MKFGGASVATAEQFSTIAKIILTRCESSLARVVVVVSAMGDTTDELLIA